MITVQPWFELKGMPHVEMWHNVHKFCILVCTSTTSTFKVSKVQQHGWSPAECWFSGWIQIMAEQVSGDLICESFSDDIGEVVMPDMDVLPKTSTEKVAPWDGNSNKVYGYIVGEDSKCQLLHIPKSTTSKMGLQVIRNIYGVDIAVAVNYERCVVNLVFMLHMNNRSLLLTDQWVVLNEGLACA